MRAGRSQAWARRRATTSPPSMRRPAQPLLGTRTPAAGGFHTIGRLPQSGIAAITADVPTPTFLSLISARAFFDRVELTWYASARDVPGARVYRRTVGGDWQEMAKIWADGTGQMAYE